MADHLRTELIVGALSNAVAARERHRVVEEDEPPAAPGTRRLSLVISGAAVWCRSAPGRAFQGRGRAPIDVLYSPIRQ